MDKTPERRKQLQCTIQHLGTMPESEMKEAALFEEIPSDLTYPNVSPRLYEEAQKLLEKLGSG